MSIILTYRKRYEKSFSKLQADRQLAAVEALERFQLDPRHRGLNFEQIRGRPELYTIRVDLKLRICLFPSFESDTSKIVAAEIVDIGNHDDIYRR